MNGSFGARATQRATKTDRLVGVELRRFAHDAENGATVGARCDIMVDHAVDAGRVDAAVGEKWRGRDGKDAFGVDRKHGICLCLGWAQFAMCGTGGAFGKRRRMATVSPACDYMGGDLEISVREEIMNESRSVSTATAEAASPPFDSARLDALLDEAGMDAVVISFEAQHPISLGRLPVLFLRSFRRDRRQPLFAPSRLRQRPPRSVDLYRAGDGILREGARQILDPRLPGLEHKPRFRAARRRPSAKTCSGRETRRRRARVSCPPMRRNS